MNKILSNIFRQTMLFIIISSSMLEVFASSNLKKTTQFKAILRESDRSDAIKAVKNFSYYKQNGGEQAVPYSRFLLILTKYQGNGQIKGLSSNKHEFLVKEECLKNFILNRLKILSTIEFTVDENGKKDLLRVKAEFNNGSENEVATCKLKKDASIANVTLQD